MTDESTIARYRKLYGLLLRLYPQRFRERFAEGMEQTFRDLCRERVRQDEKLWGFVVWVFIETIAGITRENAAFMMTQHLPKRLVTWAIVVACILMIPVWGNRNVEGWNWSFFDFIAAGIALFGSTITYELIAMQRRVTAYRLAVGLAVLTGLLLLWVNGAVGIIGDGPVNLMFGGVLAVGLLGAATARLEPRGMARTLFTMALVQLLIPVIALVVFNPPFDPGVVPVFCLNAVFAAFWVLSGLMFRKAARRESPAVTGT